MKKLIIAAAAIAATALAPTAGAASLYIVSGSPTAPDASGFAVAATDGWHLDACWGTGFWDANGVPVGPLSTPATNPPELHTASIEGDGDVAWLEWGTWSGYTSTVRVACDAHKTVTSVTYPLRWRWFTKARFGTNTTTRSHSGSCYMNRSYYPSGLHLDCWGGSYAQATYRFALPSDARRISRNIRTEQGCCASLGGSTSKRWSGNTAIVRATGWAGIYVKRVSVEYQHRVKVRTVTTKELTTRLTTTF